MKEKKSQSEYLYYFFYTLFKRKYFALAVFLSTFGGIVFGTFLVTPLWKGEAKVRVQYSPKQQLSMLEGITTPGMLIPGINPANDVIQILRSRELAEKLALEYKRDELWRTRVESPFCARDVVIRFINNYLNPIEYLYKLRILSKQPVNYLAKAVKELQEDLIVVELEEETSVINLTVWGESPKIATNMSNALINLLLEKNHDFSRMPVIETIESTKKLLEKAKQNLMQTQQELRKFKRNSGFILFENEAQILLTRLDRYKNEMNNLEGRLVATKVENGVGHNQVKSLNLQIEEYRNRIIPELNRELVALAVNEVEFEKIQNDLKIRESSYKLLEEKLLVLEILKDSPIGDLEIKVVEPAKVYSNIKPGWPKKIINIILGIFCGVFMSLFTIFFLEYWNTSYRSLKKLEEEVPAEILGAVAAYSGKKAPLLSVVQSSETETAGKHKPAGEKQKMLSLLVDNVLSRSKGATGRKILVTSPGFREGKTTVAALLAKSISLRDKKVLLIDANLQNPELADVVGGGAALTSGFIDFLKQRKPLEEIVSKCGTFDAICTSAAALPEQAELFEMLTSESMTRMLESLSVAYDFIFIDSPCMKKYRDPVLLAGVSDNIILIVEANKTPRRTIMMALNKLKDAEGKLMGIVLNRQINYVPDLVQQFINL